MADPTIDKYINLRCDDSKTEAQITGSPSSYTNKIMIPSDKKGIIYFVDEEDTPIKLVKSDLTASTAPSVTDDADDGFQSGSFRLNTSTGYLYYCTDPTAGAAVWVRLAQFDDVTLQSAYDNGGGTIATDSTGGELAITGDQQVTIEATDGFGECSVKVINYTSAENPGVKITSESGDMELETGQQMKFQDRYLTSPVTLSESGEAALDTTSDSIVGAINEVKATADAAETSADDAFHQSVAGEIAALAEITPFDGAMLIEGDTSSTGGRTKYRMDLDTAANFFASETLTGLDTTASTTKGAINEIHGEVNTNTADIATNTGDIATNTADIATLDERVNGVLSVTTSTGTVTDAHRLVDVDYTATGQCTLTIESAAIADNTFRFTVRDIDRNASVNSIYIATEGSETINGQAGPLEINWDGAIVDIYSDGTQLIF